MCPALGNLSFLNTPSQRRKNSKESCWKQVWTYVLMKVCKSVCANLLSVFIFKKVLKITNPKISESNMILGGKWFVLTWKHSYSKICYNAQNCVFETIFSTLKKHSIRCPNGTRSVSKCSGARTLSECFFFQSWKSGLKKAIFARYNKSLKKNVSKWLPIAAALRSQT